MSDILPPAGSLLIMLNTFADTFELTAECDNFLRSQLPTSVAYEVLKVFTETDDLYRMEDPSSVVIGTARRLTTQTIPNDFYMERLMDRCKERDLPNELAKAASVVQAMQLVDDFCDACGVTALGEKELKFALPVDSMFHLIFDLYASRRNWVLNGRQDFLVVSHCRKIRYARGIDIGKDPVMSIVAIDRTILVSKPVHAPVPSRNPLLVESCTSFPLNMKSKWAWSGPSVVFVLSLTEIEDIVCNWLKKLNVIGTEFITMYPFDCVVRAIRASPNSFPLAQQLIEESLRTKDRFIFHSLSELRSQIDTVVFDHQLGDQIHMCLTSKLSLTYSHYIVYGTVNKRDCPILAKGPKRITIPLLRDLMTTAAKKSIAHLMVDEEDSETTITSKDAKLKKKSERDPRRGGRWTKEEWDEWENKRYNKGLNVKGRERFKSASRCRDTKNDEKSNAIEAISPNLTNERFEVDSVNYELSDGQDELPESPRNEVPTICDVVPETPSTNTSSDGVDNENSKNNVRYIAPSIAIETCDDLIDI